MKTNTQAITGTLTIGDQWNAITIIAHSQTHPLKAICELTENAIDAGATSVRISRRRSSRSRTTAAAWLPTRRGPLTSNGSPPISAIR